MIKREQLRKSGCEMAIWQAANPALDAKRSTRSTCEGYKRSMSTCGAVFLASIILFVVTMRSAYERRQTVPIGTVMG